jgi:hypothetical protein
LRLRKRSESEAPSYSLSSSTPLRCDDLTLEVLPAALDTGEAEETALEAWSVAAA